MGKVSKHRRIKRPTVLIKRTRCIKNTKKVIKSPPPLYQKLKVNNHSLAVALSQERQEYQMLFARNNELLGEVQDLVHACNKRDLVIANILKNSKEIMQTLVTMSGFLTNVISSCQEFVANQIPHRASSSSSASRRESIRRLSAKSPARGVVKPMVSGHTITKPTINLSRVNMQRPPNTNLSIIDESASSTPERSSDRAVQESRRSRGLSERLPVPTHRSEEDDERVIINRQRSSRFSGGRLSSGRYSKRNSGRLSGGSIAGRLSKRTSDSFELNKSPRVTLQDVSRYLTNSQTVNVRTLPEPGSNSSSPEDSQPSVPSSPENNNLGMIHPTSQEDSESSSDSDAENVPVQKPSLPRKSTMKSRTAAESANKSTVKRSVRFQSRSSSTYTYDSDNPLEGPSWLYSNTLSDSEVANMSQENQENRSPNNRNSSAEMEQSSPVSSLSPERRRSSGNFRVPELPKRFVKPPAASRLNLNDEFDSPDSRTVIGNAFETSSYANHNGTANGEHDNENNDDEDDDSDRRVNLCFITQRRGRTNDVEDDDDDDDETIMLNMQRQLRPQAQQQQQQQPQSPEQSERLQFDINEMILQLTPLKPLLDIQCSSNGPVQPEPEAEPTVTVQLTQRVVPIVDETTSISQMTTIKANPPATASGRNQEAGTAASSSQENRRFSELSTSRLSSRIDLPRLSTRLELPRLTELHNNTIAPEESSSQQYQQSQILLTPTVNGNSSKLEVSSRDVKKRKRAVAKYYKEVRNSGSEEEEEEEEETPKQKKKKPKQRKKKSENKDPSSAKVVLQKLNETQRKSDESISSARSSVMSRADPSSDSECSTNSNNSRPTSSRPRRQKAPKNLAEPNMKKKLRR